jgi:hypothetical protein
MSILLQSSLPTTQTTNLEPCYCLRLPSAAGIIEPWDVRFKNIFLCLLKLTTISFWSGIENMKPSAILAIFLLALGSMTASAQANTSPGVVTISYNLFHPHWIASNQLAIWIEDAHGVFVKTIFATDFMARRKGYIKRPQSCPEWVKASGLANLSDASIDAASGATQKPGPIELSWNCTDTNGKAIAPGAYTYKVEGNISWEKRVLWEGKIEVSSKPSTSSATPTYIPDSARTAGTILTEVRAKFQPSH